MDDDPFPEPPPRATSLPNRYLSIDDEVKAEALIRLAYSTEDDVMDAAELLLAAASKIMLRSFAPDVALRLIDGLFEGVRPNELAQPEDVTLPPRAAVVTAILRALLQASDETPRTLGERAEHRARIVEQATDDIFAIFGLYAGQEARGDRDG